MTAAARTPGCSPVADTGNRQHATEPTPTRRPIPCALTPVEALQRLRGRERLVGLIGDWAGGGAIIASDPVARAGHLSELSERAPLGPTNVIGGGWIGALGYQHGATLEVLPDAPYRPTPKPECDFAYYDHLIKYESARGTWWFESIWPEGQSPRIESAYRDLVRRLGTDRAPEARPYRCGVFGMRPDADGHRNAIARAIEHINAGDIFQTNLAVRLEAAFEGDPLDVFVRGVTELSPAYAAYVATDSGAVVSFSPELFLRRAGRNVLSSPIKGTAPLATAPERLAASNKDRAENIMIVDLMRNDLGRVSVPGSVAVQGQVRVEQHAGVWHLLTDVTSTLRTGVTDVDLLRATFPPGSVTGAPKVSAMEIINELEETGRETYTGAVGLVSAGLLELNVAIRTLEFTADTVWLGVGGGIVTGSTPDGELAECLTKAEPLLRAIGADLADSVASPVRSSQRTVADRVAQELRGEDPLFLVDDLGLHLNVRGSQLSGSPALNRVLGALRGADLNVHEGALSRDDLRRAAEAFAVEPGGALRAVSTVTGRPEPATAAGPLTRWLAARIGSAAILRHELRVDSLSRPNGSVGGRVLLIDNYDSFVFNLSQYCNELGADTDVIRHDPKHLDTTVAAVRSGYFNYVILSPGPGAPADAGMCVPLIRHLAGVVPILGVCLGHQVIGEAFGARTGRAPRPVHGQQTLIHHDGLGIYQGLPGPFNAARYHSLVIDEDTLPAQLAPTARTPSGLLMGVRHTSFDIEGIQAHPESVITPVGHQLLRNFLTRSRHASGGRRNAAGT